VSASHFDLKQTWLHYRLADGQPITRDFKHETAPPKAVCTQESGDAAQFLLAEGWARFADGITDEAYVEAAALAKNRKSGHLGRWAALRAKAFG